MKNLARRAGASLAAIGIVVAGTIGLAAPAHADEDYGRLLSFWDTYGVSPEVQEELLAGLEVGILPDSSKGTEEPVSLVTSTVSGEEETVATYADGSISVWTVDVAQSATKSGGATTNSVTGCAVSTYTGVSYYTNCRIGGDNGIVVLGFYANFTQSNAGYDSIQSYWGVVVQCAPGTCSTPYLNGVKLNENSSGKAYVIYSVQYNAGVWGTTTNSLTLFVGLNTHSGVFS